MSACGVPIAPNVHLTLPGEHKQGVKMKPRGHYPPGPQAEKGAVAVEFALVLPVLLLIVSGIVNFGVVLAQDLALGNGARQAARFAAVQGNSCDAVRKHARQNSVAIALSPTDISDDKIVITATPAPLTPNCPSSPCGEYNATNAASGRSVRVEIDHVSQFLIPMPIPGFPTSVSLKGRGEFRCEF